MSSIFEIVTYTVTDREKAETGRQTACKVVADYPGFISWTCFSETDTGKHFVDLIEWDSAENAKAAQDRFPQDSKVQAIMSVFDESLAMVLARKV